MAIDSTRINGHNAGAGTRYPGSVSCINCVEIALSPTLTHLPISCASAPNSTNRILIQAP
jgi:hypothetical protein